MIRNDEHDISETANSAKCSCRQNNSDGCSTVGPDLGPMRFQGVAVDLAAQGFNDRIGEELQRLTPAAPATTIAV